MKVSGENLKEFIIFLFTYTFYLCFSDEVKQFIAPSVGGVEYTDCFSEEG